MMLSLMILLMSTTAFTMFLAMNPVSLGIMILMMALLLAVSFAYSMSSWVAFLIFLIYVGGMLVMFSYFVAIIPNQNLSIIHIMISMIISLLSLFTITHFLNINPSMMSTMTNQLNILYMKSTMNILILLASILLFTMIVVVKLTTLSKGPLRPFM